MPDILTKVKKASRKISLVKKRKINNFLFILLMPFVLALVFCGGYNIILRETKNVEGAFYNSYLVNVLQNDTTAEYAGIAVGTSVSVNMTKNTTNFAIDNVLAYYAYIPEPTEESELVKQSYENAYSEVHIGKVKKVYRDNTNVWYIFESAEGTNVIVESEYILGDIGTLHPYIVSYIKLYENIYVAAALMIAPPLLLLILMLINITSYFGVKNLINKVLIGEMSLFDKKCIKKNAGYYLNSEIKTQIYQTVADEDKELYGYLLWEKWQKRKDDIIAEMNGIPVEGKKKKRKKKKDYYYDAKGMENLPVVSDSAGYFHFSDEPMSPYSRLTEHAGDSLKDYYSGPDDYFEKSQIHSSFEPIGNESRAYSDNNITPPPQYQAPQQTETQEKVAPQQAAPQQAAPQQEATREQSAPQAPQTQDTQSAQASQPIYQAQPQQNIQGQVDLSQPYQYQNAGQMPYMQNQYQQPNIYSVPNSYTYPQNNYFAQVSGRTVYSTPNPDSIYYGMPMYETPKPVDSMSNMYGVPRVDPLLIADKVSNETLRKELSESERYLFENYITPIESKINNLKSDLDGLFSNYRNLEFDVSDKLNRMNSATERGTDYELQSKVAQLEEWIATLENFQNDMLMNQANMGYNGGMAINDVAYNELKNQQEDNLMKLNILFDDIESRLGKIEEAQRNLESMNDNALDEVIADQLINNENLANLENRLIQIEETKELLEKAKRETINYDKMDEKSKLINDMTSRLERIERGILGKKYDDDMLDFTDKSDKDMHIINKKLKNIESVLEEMKFEKANAEKELDALSKQNGRLLDEMVKRIGNIDGTIDRKDSSIFGGLSANRQEKDIKDSILSAFEALNERLAKLEKSQEKSANVYGGDSAIMEKFRNIDSAIEKIGTELNFRDRIERENQATRDKMEMLSKVNSLENKLYVMENMKFMPGANASSLINDSSSVERKIQKSVSDKLNLVASNVRKEIREQNKKFADLLSSKFGISFSDLDAEEYNFAPTFNGDFTDINNQIEDKIRRQANSDAFDIQNYGNKEAADVLTDAERESQIIDVAAEKEAQLIKAAAEKEIQLLKKEYLKELEQLKNSYPSKIQYNDLISIKAKAEEQADMLLDEAENKAEEILSRAQERAQELERQANAEIEKLKNKSVEEADKIKNDAYEALLRIQAEKEAEEKSSKENADQSRSEIANSDSIDVAMEKFTLEIEEKIKKLHENADAEIAEFKLQAEKAAQIIKEEAEKVINARRKSVENVNSISKELFAIHKDAERESEELIKHAQLKEIEIKANLEKQIEKLKLEAKEKQEAIRKNAESQANAIKADAEEKIKNNENNALDLFSIKTDAESQARELVENAEKESQLIKLNIEKEILNVKMNSEKEIQKLTEDAEREAKLVKERAEEKARELKGNADRNIENLKQNLNAKYNTDLEIEKLNNMLMSDDILNADAIAEEIKKEIASQSSVIRRNAELEAERIRNEVREEVKRLKISADDKAIDVKSQLQKQRELEENVKDIEERAKIKAQEIIADAEAEAKKLKDELEYQAKIYYDKSKAEAEGLLNEAENNIVLRNNEINKNIKLLKDAANFKAEELRREGENQTIALKERAALEVEKIRSDAEKKANELINQSEEEIKLLNHNYTQPNEKDISEIRLKVDKEINEINKRAEDQANEINERKDKEVNEIKAKYEKLAHEILEKAEMQVNSLLNEADNAIVKKESLLEADAESIKADAKEQAEELKKNANSEKDKLLARAEEEADRIMSEAQKRADEILASVKAEEIPIKEENVSNVKEEEVKNKLNKIITDSVNEADKIRKDNEQAITALVESSQTKAGEIINTAQVRAQQINAGVANESEEKRLEAELESLKILQKAELEAQMILENAESEKERLRLKAEEDAKKVIEIANAEAEKFRIILESLNNEEKESEEKLLENQRLYEEKIAKAEKESKKIISEAEESAQEVKENALKKGEEIIENAERAADKLYNDAENKIQNLMAEINRNAIYKKQQLEREAIESKAKAEEEVLRIKKQAELEVIKAKEQALMEVEKIKISAQIEADVKIKQLNEEIIDLKKRIAEQSKVEENLRAEIKEVRDNMLLESEESKKLSTLNAKETEAIKKSIEKQAFNILKASEERAKSIIFKAGLEADKIKLKTEIEAEQILNNAEKEAGLLKVEAEKEAFQLRIKATSKAHDVKQAIEKQAYDILEKAEKEARQLKDKAQIKAKELKSNAEVEIQYLLENNEENMQKLLEYNAKPKKIRRRKSVKALSADNSDLEAYINSVIEQYKYENNDVKVGDLGKVKEVDLLDKLNKLKNKMESIRLREKIVKDYISYTKRKMLDEKRNEILKKVENFKTVEQNIESKAFADKKHAEDSFIEVSEFESKPEDYLGEVIISSGKPIDGENEVKTVKHSSIFTNAIKKNNEVKEVKFFETQSAVNNDSHSNSDNNEKNKNDKLSENSKIVSTKNAIEYGKEVAASVEDEDYDDEEESGSKSTKRAPKLLDRLKEADKSTQDNFTKIKNHILSYIGINDRFSYKFDTFTYNSSPLIKLTLRNSTIKLYMNIDPAIIDPKYFVKNVSDLKIYEQTPSLLKVASKRGVKYAIELIDMLMLNFSISPKSKFSPLHFSQLLYGVSPYETALSRLKKVLKKSASAEDAWTLDDDSAEDLILIKSGFDADAYNGAKTVELGISELGEKFNDNDIVDFESLANKGLLNINEKCLIRIVAGNKVLDKSLTVIANEFTMDAAKLILITGGKAVVIK